MKRISNNLFEAIQTVTTGKQVEEGQVDKAHFCATHVEHALYGPGECISEEHAAPDENGNIEWYTVKFETGTHKINAENLKIVEGKSHTHGKKMKEEAEAVEEGNDGNLANNAKPYDKVTRGDVIAGRLGKDEMGGKKKKMAEDFEFSDEELDQAVSEEDQIETVLDEEIIQMTEKYMGFSKTVGALKAKGAKNPAALAAWIGRKKYGKKKFQAAAAKGTSLRGESVEEAKKPTRSTGTAFDWKGKASSITADERSSFNKKKISTGTVYSRKYAKDEKEKMKESISQTIINHDGYVLEITNNPTFKDYFNAVQSLIPESSEEIKQEIVSIATEAHSENYLDVIVQAEAKKVFESKIKEHKNVVNENYVIDADEVYVEYVVEQDGKFVQYVHTGKVVLK